MAITIDYGNTNVILVPKSDLTLVSGTFYTYDTDAMRLELKDIEDSEDGMAFPDTHSHFTEYTVAGITYARAFLILSPYSVEFEDGAYSVQLEGSNNNVWDVGDGILVQNQVQVIPTNSAGNTSQPRVNEVHQYLGLDAANPVTMTGDGETTKTVVVGGMTVTFTPTDIVRT